MSTTAEKTTELVDPAERSRSRLILICFLSFFLLCIPTHIITSRVYRGPLPSHDTINELQSHLDDIMLHPKTYITCHIISNIDQTLLKTWHNTVKDKLSHIKREWYIDGTVLPSIQLSSSPHEIDDILQKHTSSHSHYTFFLLPCTSSTTWYMGRHTHGWRCIGETPHEWDNMATSLVDMIEHVLLPVEALPDSRDLLRLPTHISQHSLSLTLLNGMSPATQPLSWDIQEGVETWLRPFLSKTERIITWHTDSQVLYYGELASNASPIKAQDGDSSPGYYVTPHQLRNFIGTTSWNVVSPLVSSSIELLVYVPNVEKRPMYIKHSTKKEIAPSNSDLSPPGYSSSFLVPRWGGVVIYNPTHNDTVLNVKQLQPVFESFVAQLRVMIGLPPYHQSTSSYIILPSPSDGISDWELDALCRARVLENAVRIEDTLRSLYALLERVRHMPVDDHIAHNVTHAVQQFKEALSLYRSGSWSASITASRSSLTSAQSGFFDSSMIPLLYFPDEHLYAVYAPLFLPIIIPVFSATMKIIKSFKQKKVTHVHVE